MSEHAVVTATWAETPIYCRIIPWSERILGMSRPQAVAERERYSRGELWCECVSDVYPEGFFASIDVTTMRAIGADEFEDARERCRRSFDPEPFEVEVRGRLRVGGWLRRRRLAAAS